MKVLVADDDATFRDLVVDTLRKRTEHTVVAVEDGAKALSTALTLPRPDVIVLDWMMPKMNGTSVCRQIRSSPLATQPHILFVTARTRREEIIECLAAGADDLLTKPFAPDMLVTRVELGRPRTSLATGQSLRRALMDAQHEGGGELVIRSGDVCARVLFAERKVAWVHHMDGSGSLLDALAPEAGIDPDTARAVVQECRRSGAGLSETLASWGLVDRAKLRNAMRLWIGRKLTAMCTLPEPQVLFLPSNFKSSPELLFELDEVLEAETHPAQTRGASERAPTELGEKRPTLIPAGAWSSAFLEPQVPSVEVKLLLEHCMAGEGVLGVVVLDRSSGLCLGRLGIELVPDVAWAQLQALNAVMSRESVEDSIVTTSRHLHLTALAPKSGALVYVLVDATETLVAVARLNLKRAIGLGP